MKLNPKQARFVQEYLIDLNATQAAIRAGYSKKTAEQLGHQLLKKPLVAEAIIKAQAGLSDKNGNLIQKILDELAIIAFSDIKNYLDIDQDTGGIRAKSFDDATMPDKASRALEMVREDRMIREDAKGNDSIINSKITFKMHDKLKAIELLGKHLGMFPNKIEGNLHVSAGLTFDFGDNGNGKDHE